MTFYTYLACFFAGMFLANFVPHFVHGISGNRFPTPFSKPRGIGLSSSTTNVIWALFNLIAGGILFRAGKITQDTCYPQLVFLIGVAVMSIALSIRFRAKHKE